MRRKLGYALLTAGICLLAWVGTTLYWGDPVTSVYTSYEQRGLSSRLTALERVWAANAQEAASSARLHARVVAFQGPCARGSRSAVSRSPGSA